MKFGTREIGIDQFIPSVCFYNVYVFFFFQSFHTQQISPNICSTRDT